MRLLGFLGRLFRKRTQDWKKLTQTLIGSPDPKARWEAAEALVGSPAEPELLEALARALGDDHPFVRWKAGEALLSIGGEEVIRLLLELLNRRDSVFRMEAARLLGKFKDSRAVESLSRALRSKSELVRWSAAEGLLDIGDEEAINCLKKFTNDPAWGVRRAVALGLGKGAIPKEEALPLLAELAKDSHPTVRSAAARAMGNLRAPDAEPALVTLLRDPHPQVRAEAASALGRIGGKEALASLGNLLEDQEMVFGETIASRVRKAIGLIKRRMLLAKLPGVGKRFSSFS
ncbi:MAG: HEAT repeat domain-containing protein [Anaerolineae bacterium]|nr:HEAT repeat domain-containing protein [Anaerolineae bacterium]MDW8102986.1 HEAT repeat domain-containing protein [Anaerolineae bacterium]